MKSAGCQSTHHGTISEQRSPVNHEYTLFFLSDIRDKAAFPRSFLSRRRFQAESESGRREMIENYKTELMQSRAENEISLVPADFQIERTSYTESEGTVTVIEWFDYISFRERKRFTYNLARRDNIWRINGYTVDNLGTE